MVAERRFPDAVNTRLADAADLFDYAERDQLLDFGTGVFGCSPDALREDLRRELGGALLRKVREHLVEAVAAEEEPVT